MNDHLMILALWCLSINDLAPFQALALSLCSLLLPALVVLDARVQERLGAGPELSELLLSPRTLPLTASKELLAECKVPPCNVRL